MANMMREHMPSDSRMHYVITSGGSAPNVVPDFAEVYYYVRHMDAKIVESIFDRLVKVSEGAALGTGTTVEHEVIGGAHNLLANEALARVMHEKLNEVGGFSYTPEEQAFAREDLRRRSCRLRSRSARTQQVQAFDFERRGLGSTDVGDVSWTVPTVGLRTATWVPGTPAHSWQATAAGGMSIGYKGMNVASQTLALAGRSCSRALISSRKPGPSSTGGAARFPVPRAARRPRPGARLPQGRPWRRQIENRRWT